MTHDREDAGQRSEHEEGPRVTGGDDVVAMLRELMRDVHSLPPVDAEPTARLVRWPVIEVHGYRYLLGWCLHHREGRISTPVTGCATDARHALTLSGRVYALEGAPGWDGEAMYVLEARLRAKGWSRDDVVDVTTAWGIAERHWTSDRDAATGEDG